MGKIIKKRIYSIGDDNLKRFNEGDTVYFVASSIFVRKAKVVRNAGGFCTIIFDGNGNCGTSGTRVRESKLYRTEEEVELLQSQIDEASSTSERVKLFKQLKKINEQLLELNKYEEVVHHWGDKMEPMDLDDGVKANYVKFQELLAKIK